MHKLIVNKFFRAIFPFLILIPSYFVLPGKVDFFIYNGCVVYLITGFYLRSKAKYLDVLLKGFINIFILVTIICAFIFLKLQLSFEYKNILRTAPFAAICISSFTLSLWIGFLLIHNIKKSDWGRFIFIIILVNLLMINLATFGKALHFSTGGILFIIGGYILATNNLKWNTIVFCALSGPLVIIISFLMFNDRLYHILPILLIIPLGTSIGIYLKILRIDINKRIQMYSILFLSVLILVTGYFGTLNWCEYSFSNKENNPNINNLSIQFKTLDGYDLNENNFLNKITVLYLWTTSCNVCYSKMPELEKLTKTFCEDKDIQIFAIAIPASILDTVSFQALNKLSKKYKINYAISMDNTTIVTKNFNFNTFPHVLIIDGNRNVVFNGRFNNNPVIRVNNITSILNSESYKFKKTISMTYLDRAELLVPR